MHHFSRYIYWYRHEWVSRERYTWEFPHNTRRASSLHSAQSQRSVFLLAIRPIPDSFFIYNFYANVLTFYQVKFQAASALYHIRQKSGVWTVTAIRFWCGTTPSVVSTVQLFSVCLCLCLCLSLSVSLSSSIFQELNPLHISTVVCLYVCVCVCVCVCVRVLL